ncbi:hypothetical protein Tco_0647449, partial [Tanacetum coccineum]
GAEQQKCYGVLPKENAAILDFYLKDIRFDAHNNHNLKESGHDSDAESTCQSGYHEDAGFYHGGAEIYHGDTDQSDTDKACVDA